MAEKKLSYREVPIALKYVIKTLWRISPSYVLLSIFYSLKDRLIPYATLFIAAAVTSKLPGLINHQIKFTEVIWLVALLLIIELSNLLLDLVFQKQKTQAESMVSINMREHFFGAYAALPYRLYEDKDVIDAFNYADQFMYRFSQFGLQQIIRSLGSFIEIIIVITSLFAVAWFMPIIFVLFLPPLIISLIKVNREQARVYFENRPLQRRIWAIEAFFYPRGIKETRLYGVVGHFLADRRANAIRMQQRDQDINIKKAKLGFWQDGVMQFAGFLASGIALWRIAYRSAPLGTFVLAQQLTSRGGAAVKSLFTEISSFDEDLYGFAEYRYITEELQPKSLPAPIDKIHKPSIKIEGLSFTYPASDSPTLKNISLDIPYGSNIAIVGENGAGKTTLTRLLLGLYQPQIGEINVNGANLKQIRENDWLKHIGVLLQDFGMFEDLTISEAVWLGDVSKPRDKDAVMAVLKEVGLDKKVQAFPHGLDSYIGKWMDREKGIELSGGETQRLAIARALFRSPEILILDEPTSSIDAKAEERIFGKLMKSRKGKTTIFISHRFSTVRRAENIAFMENGEIAEFGTHEELMKLKGKYHQMFTAQAEGYK